MTDIRAPKNVFQILNRLHHVKKMGTEYQADCPVLGHGTPANHLHIKDEGDKALVTSLGANHTHKQIAEAMGFDSLTYGNNGVSSISIPKAESRIVAIYDYIDLNLKLLYQVVRYDPKDFRQRRPDGNGNWIWNLAGVTLVPFCLPDIRTAVSYGDLIYIPEGEKDVLNLWGIGLVSTCNSGGANKWKQEYSEYLRGGNVTIIPDNGTAGYAHAKQVGNSLYGIVATLKILKIPSPYKDVSDAGPCFISGGSFGH